MSAFLAIMRNVLRSGFRNRVALFFTLGLAFLFMVVFGLLFSGGAPRLSIGVVDADHSPLARAFVESLAGQQGLIVETGGEATERDRLQHDKLVYLAIVEPGFASARGGHPGLITTYENSSSQASAAVAAGVVGGIANAFAAQHALGNQAAIVVRPAVDVTTNNIRAIDFLLPSMIAYLVLQSGINFVAIGLVDQRNRKVLRRFLVTPLRPLQILAGNIVGGAVTVFLQVAVLVIVGITIFGARSHGDWALTGITVVVGTGAFVAIGFLLTSVARTSEAARGLAAMVAFPMMFLSGVFFSVDNGPGWLRTVIHLLPLTYLTDALHQVMNDGAGLGAIATDLMVLLGWAIVCFVIATRGFRWE